MACPPSKYLPTTGASSEETCTPCPKGQWGPEGSGSARFCVSQPAREQNRSTPWVGYVAIGIGIGIAVLGAVLYLGRKYLSVCSRDGYAEYAPAERGVEADAVAVVELQAIQSPLREGGSEKVAGDGGDAPLVAARVVVPALADEV